MKKTGRAGFQRSRLLMDAPKIPCMADPEFSKKELCVESDELRVPYNSQGRQTKREESERYFVTECGKERQVYATAQNSFCGMMKNTSGNSFCAYKKF